MENNGTSDSNPWGGEPSHAQRVSSYHAEKAHAYNQQMEDILASPPSSHHGGLDEGPRASPERAARDAADELGDDDDDGGDQQFEYKGVDRPVPASTSTSDDSSASIDMNSENYSAKLKDILGSDEEDDLDSDRSALPTKLVTDLPVQSTGTSASSPATQRAPRLQVEADPTLSSTSRLDDVEPSEDGSSFHYPHPLPNDTSFDTRSTASLRIQQQSRQRLPSQPSSSHLLTPRSTSGTGSSLLRQSNTIASSTIPQRPVAYPSLSRLRASLGKAASASLALPKHIQAESGKSSGYIPGSPSSASSRRKPRSPLPAEFTVNGLATPAAHSYRDDDASRSAVADSFTTLRSRQSSFSTSVSGSIAGHNKRHRPRVSFPYGGISNGATLPSAQSATSLLSDPASSTFSAQHLGAAPVAVLGGGQNSDDDITGTELRLKETLLNDRDELSRDFVKWSALRRVFASAKVKDDDADPIPTVLAVAGGLIAVGTQGGRSFVCDFAQEPIASCGHDGRGHGDAVTALALSSDHSFLGVGHASGNIFLYDLSNPGRAVRHVPPVPLSSVKAGKKEGHLSGSAIVHIGFVGLRHTAIVTADNKGLAFYHALGKILGVSSVDTLRLLGKYPRYEHEDELGLSDGKKHNTIFQLSPLPLGRRPHPADETTFIAMITPSKMVLVGLKPSPRTWYRKVNRPHATEKLEATTVSEAPIQQEPSCLAWYPASTETDGKRRRQTNPILAFSFGPRLHLVRLVVRKVEQRPDAKTARVTGASGAAGNIVDEVDPLELTGEDGIEEPDHIVSLQWFSPDLLMLTTKSGLALFDCRAGKVTERMRGGSASAILAKTVEQRYYDAVLLGKPFEPPGETQAGEGDGLERSQSRSWALNHSIRISKGRAFFLTKSDLVVGTLLSWADRLLLFVTQGDFLSAIELATLFHQGKFLGSAVGLPSDPNERTLIVADKLRELMSASAEYAFSPDRLTDLTHVTPDGRGVDRTSLFQGLARVSARACLSLGDLDFLFETLYDKYEDNGIEAIFVGQMEDFIVSGELRSLPIPVVQRLVAFRRDREEYDQAEKIIWHVDPKSLDLDQALSLCLERRLYDALIYVFNAALEDYVSPIIELLHPVRRAIRRRRNQEIEADSDDASSDPYAHIRVADAEAVDPADAPAAWEQEERDLEDGYRVFSYLSVILTGNQYPSQEPFEDDEGASKAKGSIYSFVFSGGCILWPPGPGGNIVLYGLDDSLNARAKHDEQNNGEHEPIYPYLRLLLEFDAEAFLDALDLAFEDGFLDDEDMVGKRISRQLIIDVLLELTSSQEPDHGSDSGPFDLRAEALERTGNKPQNLQETKSPRLPMVARIFVHIFVARNAPKYPQFIHLTQTSVDMLLRSLALPTEGSADEAGMQVVESTHEDRELAAECLLSHYKPRFDDGWLDTFQAASFHRIMRSAFRQEKKWDRLLGMYLREHLQADLYDSAGHVDGYAVEEEKRSGVDAFARFEETLFNAAREETPEKQQLNARLHEQLSDHIIDLLDLDPLKTAGLLDRFFPEKHGEVLQRLSQLDEKRLLLYLRCFFEPLQVSKATAAQTAPRARNDENPEADSGWTHGFAHSAPVTATYNVDVGRANPDHLRPKEREAYLDLLCRYDPDAVVRNLDTRASNFFDLDRLVRACRNGETAIDGSRVARNSDAALWALDRLGRSKEAFEELDMACAKTADSLVYVASSATDAVESNSAVADDLLGDLRRCVNVAVRLCIERANAFSGHYDSEDEDKEIGGKQKVAGARLDTDEVWYRLLRSLVRLVHDVAHLGASASSEDHTQEKVLHVNGQVTRPRHMLNGVRGIVQDTLSDLVSSTAAEAVSFPALFRRLTGPESDSQGKTDKETTAGIVEYYAEIRTVLDGMLSAYHLRAELLAITNKLFDRDTFHQFRRLHAQRRHGWRPGGGATAQCAVCSVPVIGPKRCISAQNSARANDEGGANGFVRSPDVEAEDLRRKAFQQSRTPSFSHPSLGLRRTSASQQSSLLTPPASLLQSHYRRAKSPYDEKAAPLASPRIDKGKGVVRSASSELRQVNGNPSSRRRGASEHGEELSEVDGYFASEFGQRPSSNVAMTRSNSTASSIGLSLRINDGPQRRGSLATEVEEAGGQDAKEEDGRDDGEEEDGDGTLTPSHFEQAFEVEATPGATGWSNGGGETLFDGENGGDGEIGEMKEAERIVVQKCGLVYHESCWKRAHHDSL